MATVFVRAANPIWWLPDHTGLSLNDEYYAFFLTNTLPYIPQAVYQDPAGTTQFSNPIEFSPAGTLPDNLYFDPTLVYRIEIRHGNTQADELIWEINDFVPGAGGGGSTIIDDELTVAPNLITNPQFADIFFASPYTYSQVASGTYTLDIAPGWQLVLVGANGSTTLTQTANAGSSGIAGNPPYYLEIENSGWTSVTLRQRLENNGAIFGGGAIAVALTAAAVGNAEVLTVSYAPSSGSATNIFQESIPTGALTAYKNAVDLPASTNADTGMAAFVDILIEMDGTSHFQLTNIQITGQSSNLSTGFDNPTDAPIFQEVTYEQVENDEFNVYKNSVLILPKNTLAVGWNFRQNPSQYFDGSPTTISTTPTYTLDQTQIWSSEVNSISVSRASDPTNFLSIGAVHSATQGTIAMLQYIDGYTILGYWGYLMSLLVRAKLASSQATPIKLKCRLFTIAGVPSAASTTYPVASWDANGDPVFAAGITARSPINDPAYVLESTYENTDVTIPVCPAMAFNSISSKIITSSPISSTLGILIYTVGTLDNAADNSILFESVSLVPNEFATDDTPKTFDQVLQECQYYYESSYPIGTVPGTASVTGNFLRAEQTTQVTFGHIYLISRGFGFQYNTIKRVVDPTLIYYSPITGTADTVTGFLRNGGTTLGSSVDLSFSTNWTGNVSSKAASAITNNASQLIDGGAAVDNFSEGYIEYHYSVDARMGF